ncbi:MAG TPA: S-layer protein domain-containing protein [Methanotrichaceae archaeon]|nr:S-layer protein domain-containing protein [Methanotrichaceae archaeon]
MSKIRLCWSILVLSLAIFAALQCASAQPTEATLVRGQFSTGSSQTNATGFGWFFYDADEGTGGEHLSVNVDGRSAEKGNLEYYSTAWSRSFQFKPWGYYQAIAFLGKPYLAGYPKSSLTDEVSSLERGELRQIIIDDDNTQTLTTNASLNLLGGYSLVLKDVSNEGDVADILLIKNQAVVDRKAVTSGDTYVYKVGDLPIILVHLASSMKSQGQDGGNIEIDGVFQVRDLPDFKLVQGGRMDGVLEVSDFSSDSIEMKNYEDVGLGRNSFIPLAGGLGIRVLDTDELIYYPEGIISDYGVHEIRGPVFTTNSSLAASFGNIPVRAQARWDTLNFSGFHFEDDQKIGRESLVLYGASNRLIQPISITSAPGKAAQVTGIQYSSFVQAKEFQFKSWGRYNTISFLGQLFFAGYSQNTSSEIGTGSLIEHDYLGQVLLDSDQPVKAEAGSSFTLANGYELQVVGVDEDKIFLRLLKDGKPVDSGTVITSGSTYLYKANIGDVNDLPIIAVHVNNVFSDGKTDLAMLDGIFQISDKVVPVEEGRDFGELRVLASNPSFIVMGNPNYLYLGSNGDIGIWPGMDIRVADNKSLRYYLNTQSYVVPSPILESINLPKYQASASRPANFSMLVRAGEITSVRADVLDPSGRTVYLKDLTKAGMGSGDTWVYAWSWNATVLKLSDDASQVLDSGQSFSPAVLYLSRSASPVSVDVIFDGQGRITSIADKSTMYYISPSEYSLMQKGSYSQMLVNQTARAQYIKIEPGHSSLRFYSVINDTTGLSSSNHTISGPLEDIKPRIIRTDAPSGRYELRLRVENVMNALRVSGLYFNVTAPNPREVYLGSASALAGQEVSIPLRVVPSGQEVSVNISYNPGIVDAKGAVGSCPAPTYIDHQSGRIRVVLPANCSSTNITFETRTIKANSTAVLGIEDVRGLQTDRLQNGSISVMAGAQKPQAKASGPALVAVLSAIVLAARARRRR